MKKNAADILKEAAELARDTGVCVSVTCRGRTYSFQPSPEKAVEVQGNKPLDWNDAV